MQFDNEQQRELVYRIIESATYPGNMVEIVVQLKSRIRQADIAPPAPTVVTGKK